MAGDVLFGCKDSCIEKVSKEGEELSLIAKGDGVEVMLQKIQPNIVFWIEPGEVGKLMEFFYILEGTVVWENSECRKEIGAGEYFYVCDLKNETHFKTQTEVKMIYVASQPVFHYLSNEIVNLTNMRKQVEKKDMYTHEHGVRLQYFSIRLGEKMRLSHKQLDILHYAALFHDLGKINVPDEILKKPGKLTFEEFELIKKHPMDGSKIIENTFLKECAATIAQHHERLDGSGYPLGLKEDEICLEAKIIAVADTYDAMTSDRPYKNGVDPKTALIEIKSLVGKQYDVNIAHYLEEVLLEDGLI